MMDNNLDIKINNAISKLEDVESKVEFFMQSFNTLCRPYNNKNHADISLFHGMKLISTEIRKDFESAIEEVYLLNMDMKNEDDK